MDKRILELLELAEVEGITLPYSPQMIVAMENTGAVVNLLTGEDPHRRGRYTLSLGMDAAGRGHGHCAGG